MTSELEDLINNDNRRKILGDNALRLAQKYYNKDRYVNDLVYVYKEVVDRRSTDQRPYLLLEQLKKIQTEDSSKNKANARSTLNSEKAFEDLKNMIQFLLKFKLSRFLILKIFYPIIMMSIKLIRKLYRIIKD